MFQNNSPFSSVVYQKTVTQFCHEAPEICWQVTILFFKWKQKIPHSQLSSVWLCSRSNLHLFCVFFLCYPLFFFLFQEHHRNMELKKGFIWAESHCFCKEKNMVTGSFTIIYILLQLQCQTLSHILSSYHLREHKLDSFLVNGANANFCFISTRVSRIEN